MQLAKKYEPKRLVEVVSQPEAVSQMLLWLAGWKKRRPLVIHGPTGSGKTAAVHALAAEKGFEVIELGNEDSDIERILPAIKQHSLTHRPKLVVVEGAEQLPTRILSSIVKESVFPVILFVDDVWKPKFASLRAASEVLQFKKVPRMRIEKILTEIGHLEKLPEGMTFRTFAEAAGGDVRAALIDLDSGSDAARDRTTNVFDVLKAVFKGTPAEAAAAIGSCDKDPHQIMWWVEENIPNEFSDPAERAAAFELLSKADLRKRCCSELLSCFSAVRRFKPRAYTAYRPPKFRPVALDDEICLQLAIKMHCSPSKARQEMDFLKPVLK